MKNIYIYKKYLKNCKEVGLLEDLKISHLNVNFIIFYIIQKMFMLIKNKLNYVKGSILKYFLKEYSS